MGHRVALALALVVGLCGAPASAADDRAERARLHYEKGLALYNLARYPDALTEFEAGYLEKPDPVFLFNMAQCQRQAGNGVEAVRLYRTYLRAAPDAANRADVEKRIQDLEDAERAKAAPPTGVAPPAVDPSPPPVVVRPAEAGRPLPPAAMLAPTAPRPKPEPAPPTAERPLLRRWWFWVAVTALAAGAAVGIAVATGKGNPVCQQGYQCM